MNDEEDIQWVRLTLEGHSRAFESIVRKYHKPLYNIAYRMVSDKEDAEDVVQSTFLKAFLKLKTFNIHLKFFSWLYRIAINESLNAIKQKHRHSEIDDNAASPEKLPDEFADDQLALEKFQTALAALSFDLRIVIVLNHFMFMSYQDISQILDIPETTVKSRLFTARQALKNIFSKKGMDTK
ncbi:sigma-70 family RNA polymerase sigma factor [bacterium]|nr:sigma-70 family RNA polymerase sigma factor [bacterium]